MPTNRTRATRARIGTGYDVPEEIFQAFTSAGFGHLAELDKGWLRTQTEAELRKAWKKYRAAILARDMAANKARGRAGRRPEAYFEELEAKHPRKKIGSEKWLGPQKGPEPRKWHNDPVYESDSQFLDRLGLLEPWEKEVLDNKEVKKKVT
jgi:hypothetical protein